MRGALKVLGAKDETQRAREKQPETGMAVTAERRIDFFRLTASSDKVPGPPLNG